MRVIGWLLLTVIGVIIVIWAISSPPASTNQFVNLNSTENSNKKTESNDKEKTVENVKIDDLVIGGGPKAKAGDTLTVNYKGTLVDGSQFDSSYDRGKTFDVTLGQGSVIPGWEIGLEGMQVGGKRKLTIPPELGYGTQGAGDSIPPNSTLIFEIELVKLTQKDATKTTE